MEALTTPERTSGMDEVHEAFGESKTVREWLADPRCRVSNYGMLAQRLKRERGTFEEALTTPFQGGDRRLRREGIQAFGEHKRLCDWLADPRCVVGRTCVAFRLKQGWSPEEALTTPIAETTLAAFGEAKTLREWAADPRCEVCADTLRDRLNAGLDPETAITRPSRNAKKAA